jgi:hypothetical protein
MENKNKHDNTGVLVDENGNVDGTVGIKEAAVHENENTSESTIFHNGKILILNSKYDEDLFSRNVNKTVELIDLLKDEADFKIKIFNAQSDQTLLLGYYNSFNSSIKNKNEIIKLVNLEMSAKKNKEFLFIFENWNLEANLEEYITNVPRNTKVLICVNDIKQDDLIKNNAWLKDKIEYRSLETKIHPQTNLIERLFSDSVSYFNFEVNDFQIIMYYGTELLYQEVESNLIKNLLYAIKISVCSFLRLDLDRYENFQNKISKYIKIL